MTMRVVPLTAEHWPEVSTIVGTRERIGRMTHGPLARVWRDVIMIERRSPAI
jgi:hypothetical protein